MIIPPVVVKKKRKWPLEKAVESRLRLAVKRAGGKCPKFSSPNNAGVSDRIVIYQGESIYVEVKAEKGTPEPTQNRFINEMLDQGVYACFVYGYNGVDQFMDDLLNFMPIHREYNEPKRRKKK